MQLTELLKDARTEITLLRRQNEIMSARLRMFDELMQMFHSTPAQPLQVAAPDVAWMLEQKIAELETPQPVRADRDDMPPQPGRRNA